MYKVNYYTLAKCKNGTVGNIRQYSDVWYTDQEISVLETELQRVNGNKFLIPLRLTGS